jgi:hypothetical protein
MPKREQEPKEEEINRKEDEQAITKTKLKYELLSKIGELEILAKKSVMLRNYEDAIKYAEQIIRLAILGDLSNHISEQQTFLNKIAESVHKEYTVEEIQNVGKGIQKIYETLIEAEKYQDAHIILNDFKNEYSDIQYFNSIPLIQELITRDNQLWTKYQSALQEDFEEIAQKQETKDFKSELEDIKKFLKTL